VDINHSGPLNLIYLKFKSQIIYTKYTKYYLYIKAVLM